MLGAPFAAVTIGFDHVLPHDYNSSSFSCELHAVTRALLLHRSVRALDVSRKLLSMPSSAFVPGTVPGDQEVLMGESLGA